MFKAILDGIRPLKGGGTTITLTCSDSEDIHDIVNKLRKGVHVFGENEAPVTDDRAVSLARIRSLAEQVAEAIDRELNQTNDDSEANMSLMTAMEFDEESGK